MTEETKTYVFNPDNGGNLTNGLLPGMLGGMLGGGMGNGGFGGFNNIGELIGLAIVASIFGWNNGGFGGFGGNGNGAAGFLSNQLSNDSGRELIMNAVTSQGEANRAAVQNLATMLGQDFSTVNTAVQGVQNTLNTMAIQNATTPLQIINAIQSGNSALASQFAQCCCENRLSICQQTNTLTSQADRNANAIINAINAQNVAMEAGFCGIRERELQQQIDAKNDIINQLRAQANDQYIINQVAAMIAPLQNQVNTVSTKLPSTVSVVYPNLTLTESATTTPTGN